MFVSEKGQVTIPKSIRTAAGVLPGSEVEFSLQGSKIIISAVATGIKSDRREALRSAAAKVQRSFSAPFNHMGADDIMAFLRADAPFPAGPAAGVAKAPAKVANKVPTKAPTRSLSRRGQR